MKRLVTVEEVRDTYFAGKREICVPEDAIVTPGARDLMYAFNMQLVREAPVTKEPDDQREMVAGIVESVISGRSAEEKKRVIDAVLEQLAGRSK